MKFTDERLRFSASDISNFLACRHLTRLDASLAHRKVSYPGLTDVGRNALAASSEGISPHVRQARVGDLAVGKRGVQSCEVPTSQKVRYIAGREAQSFIGELHFPSSNLGEPTTVGVEGTDRG